MRSLVLSLVAVMGCGNNGLGTDDMGMDDMAMSTDDMTASGDMIVKCDVVAQSGCMPGQKCVTAMGGGKCVTDGTVGEGQSCMRGMMGAPDNCKAGLTCSGTGLPTGMLACRKFCASDSTCTTAGEKCGIGGGGGATVGSCAPSCTAFGTGCPVGMDCSSFRLEIGSTMSALKAFNVCKTTGTGTAYAACDSMNPCAANLFCDRQAGWCAPLCDGTHACTQPPAGDGGATAVTCGTFSNLSVGYCQ